MPETHQKPIIRKACPTIPARISISKPDQPRRHSNQPDHSQIQRLKTPREKSGASAGTTTSGRSVSGSGGSAKAGSTTLPSRGRAGSTVRSSAGCNAGGCGRYAAGPASLLRLEATGAHDRNPVATRLHPPPMAGSAVCRQSPEVGAGWFNDHVRICAGGAQQYAFLPQPRGGAQQRPRLLGPPQLRQTCAVIAFRVIPNRFPTCYSRSVGGIINPRKHECYRGFKLVAGVGFEPATFRL